MKISSLRNLTDCGNMGKVTLYFHAEWHGKWSEAPQQIPAIENKTEGQDTDGGHYHGDVYHPTAHSPEVAAQEAKQQETEVTTAEADINTIEPL